MKAVPELGRKCQFSYILHLHASLFAACGGAA